MGPWLPIGFNETFFVVMLWAQILAAPALVLLIGGYAWYCLYCWSAK